MNSNKNRKFIGKFKVETPKNVFLDEFICIRSKAFSFKCGSDKLKKFKKNFRKSIEKFSI